MRPTQAVLDPGSDVMSVSERLLPKLPAYCPSVSVTHPIEGAHNVRNTDGSSVPTGKTASLLRHTEWGLVVLQPFRFPWCQALAIRSCFEVQSRNH